MGRMKNQSLSEIVRIHVFVSGKVQGVGYRYATVSEARKLGLGGWVRNLPDGRVEAVFEGTKEAVERIIVWCDRGPAPALVSDVEVEYREPEGIEGFEVRM